MRGAGTAGSGTGAESLVLDGSASVVDYLGTAGRVDYLCASRVEDLCASRVDHLCARRVLQDGASAGN